MWSLWASGLATGLALIVAIGAQNAFVLRQGIRREHVGAVVSVCIAGDAVLIAAGTAGFGLLSARTPTGLQAARWAGAGYLGWAAVRSLHSAARTTRLTAADQRSRGSVVSSTLALTVLNPHVYLDTVVLLGSLAARHGHTGRWVFAAGAATGSVLWFLGLGYGAGLLSGPLNRPRTWRTLDVGVGVVMLLIAANLVRG